MEHRQNGSAGSSTIARVLIDHVLYAARDLDEAAARLESELGLPTIAGGRHEGLGTHNKIMPLGGGYLEVIAVADPEEAASSPFGIALRKRIEDAADGLAAWAVAVEDVRPIAARLGTSINPVAREGLTAELTGVLESLQEPFLPFFITRDAGVSDPGATGGAGGISWVEVSGDAARLEQWLGGEKLPVRVSEGVARVLALGIGDRELRTG